MLTLIQILDMQLDDIAYGTVEHIEARRLLDMSCRFGNIDQIKNRCKDFIHALHVLYPGIQLGVNVEDPCHVVIAIGLTLFLFARQELLVIVLIFSVDEFELLSTRACEIGDHDICAAGCEERELCMRTGCVFLNLLPKEIVLL